MKLPAVLTRSTALRNLAITVVAGLVLFGLTEVFSEYRNTQLANAGINFCAIAGLTVLTGLSGQISLGNGAFMFIGAYTVALLLKHHPSTSNPELVLIVVAAVVVAAIVGGFVGTAAARLRGPYLAGVTLALALGVPVLPDYQHLEGPLGGHAGLIVNAPGPPGGTLDLERWQAWICCLAALVTFFVLANLRSSRVGRSFTAVRDDEIAASLAGMSVPRIQILAFVVSAGSAGLAGAMLAIIDGQIGPQSFPLQISLFLLAGAVFGGLGSMAGAAYGAVLITFLGGWSTDLSNALSLPSKVDLNLPPAFYGLVLIVSMLLFPFGLQGLVRRGWHRVRTRTRPVEVAAR